MNVMWEEVWVCTGIKKINKYVKPLYNKKTRTDPKGR